MQNDGENYDTAPAWRVVYGNDQGVLADALGDELFPSSSRPFENRIVVVPHASIKDFLFHRFATHRRLNIAAGVQVLPLNQAIMEILDSVSKTAHRKRIPSFSELSLAIEEKLHCFLPNHPEFHSLRDYVTGDEEKKWKRISALSDALARCFARYGLNGKQFLPSWLALEGWQQTIWNSLFSKDSPWTYPLESLQGAKAGCFKGKIALFGFSYLCPAHLAFFCSMPATVYQLSPCASFWGDFASDKERLSATRFFRRQGGKEAVAQELDTYMQQSHPLLANFGKLGREMFLALDAFLLEEQEIYKEEERDDLLGRLKQSVLTLDESDELQADTSIQLHSATSKLREVEVLLDSLEALLHAHHLRGDPIRPRDILIASPDISEYAPYIHMVFSQSAFSYAIEGMPLICVSEAVQGWMQLIRLPEENYALDSVLKGMRCSPFMEKRGFSSDELNQLEKWFKEAEIRRGLTGNPNSWEEGFDRLLYGLAMTPTEENQGEVWPVACIPQSEIDLFNRFVEFFTELQQDLAFLTGKKSASEWLELFVRIADSYFLIQWEKEPFFLELKSLALSCRSLQDKGWNLESMARILHHLCQKSAGKITSPKLEKITFVPLSSGHLRAARIIGCLGMDEGSFPRADERSSLCEMSRLKKGDYFLLKPDEDRSVFLEMLMLAKDYLLFSYQRVHPEDGKHQGPSLLIEELNRYLHRRGVVGGMVKTDHPVLDCISFSPRKESAFFNLDTPPSLANEEIVVDIRQLKKLARNPLQFYFNETLKIYLKEDEDEEKSEFSLSPLHKFILRKKALHLPVAHALRQSSAQGKLPRGLFQAVAMGEVEEEMADLGEMLKEFGVRSDEIHDVRFSSSYRGEENYRPALSLPLSGSRVVHITGVLEDVTPKGLLAHAKGDLQSLVKVWPLYLIYRCLDPQHKFLLLTKKGAALEIAIEDPRAALASYLDYFLLARHRPSPLMPQWAKAVLEGGEEDLKAVMSDDTEDPYLSYLKRRHVVFDKEAFSAWQTPFKKAFHPLLKGGASDAI